MRFVLETNICIYLLKAHPPLVLERFKTTPLAVQFNAGEERRIYNTLVMLAWCIRTISPEATWSARLQALLRERTDAELKSMGAPVGWMESAPWR